MPSRRSLLRTGGVLTALAVAGCQSEDGAPGEPTSDRGPTVRPNRLRATPVRPGAVETGSTVAVLTPALLELVREATATDGRVDFHAERPADPQDGRLVLGSFSALQFDGETYAASATAAGFASEASYRYTVDAVEASADDGDTVRYGSLNDAERAVADAMLDDGYSVGFHEEKTAATDPFDEHQFLRTDSGSYRIRVVVGDSAPHHMLTLTPTAPDAGTQVVTVADRPVPERVRDVVRQAVGEGAVDLTDGKRRTLASFFEGIGYVATATSVAEIEIGSAGG
ncbi:hypothetical protein ACOZ4N_15615 [Halorientalis pallida]|uniref:hypothetical protein n=1 Tax=Halorientalis pallida TaxID=2479928 RepID=UPI003C6F3BFA